MAPTVADRNAAIRILRYLYTTRNKVLTYHRSTVPLPPVATYVDSSYGNEPGARSRYGFVVCLYGCPVAWKSKKSTIVALSTAEAEYDAAVEAAKTSLWIARMAAEAMRLTPAPVVMFEDNQACIKITQNLAISARTRHFDRRMWWLRNNVQTGAIVLQYVPTEHQLADILTKILPAPRFAVLANFLLSGRSLLYGY